MKIVLERNIFTAGQHCMAKKDHRYYLVGLCLRIDHAKRGQAYATDGHVLFACSFDIENIGDDVTGIFDIIIPADAVKHAAKGKTDSLELMSLPDGSYMLDGLQFNAIDGTFPDIARVIPEPAKISGEAADYQPELLLACHKALKTWFGLKSPGDIKLHQNGFNSAQLKGPDNSAICVIMPVKTSDTGPYNFRVISTT